MIKPIAYIHCGFSSKFAIPRQSGLAGDTRGTIVFQPDYRNPEAFRGLEEFSHIWILWGFSEAIREQWSPTVRPPRLGGNERVGVFATRSPFRPNNIGLSSVKLESVDYSGENGPVLHVLGADLMDMTPIYDIKPYVPYVDSHPEADEGFTRKNQNYKLSVDFPDSLAQAVPDETRRELIGILAQDPRPSYQNDNLRIYGFGYDGFEIKFRVEDKNLIVSDVKKTK